MHREAWCQPWTSVVMGCLLMRVTYLLDAGDSSAFFSLG